MFDKKPSPVTSDLVICSFHTSDAYYTAAGDALRANLDGLGLQHEIAVIEAEGTDWIDICRQKVPFLQDVCRRHPDKRVFWIDADCSLEFLPDFIRNTSADIIGFQRGFSTPMKIGYKRRARFWEPCFWGINTSQAARSFIDKAAEAERQITLRATDDFFFEEAWRVTSPFLSFQVIPSEMVAGKSADVDPFFVFGSSGNVAEFKGQATQHSSVQAAAAQEPPAPRPLPIRALGRLRRYAKRGLAVLQGSPPAPPATANKETPFSLARAMTQALDLGRDGDRAGLEAKIAEIRSHKLLTPYQERTLEGAGTFLSYADTAFAPDQPALNLLWWDRPYPGNFGDWLSPMIMRHVTGRRVLHTPQKGPYPGAHLVGLGSIARFINPQSIVAGAGVSERDLELDTRADYVSVRGTITAEELRKNGIRPPDSFGDPGVLMARVLPLARDATNGRVALIRHYTHRRLLLRLPAHMDEFSIIQSDPGQIADFLATLIQYDRVITSAMHIYIVCQSYGIPCALVTFEGAEDAVHGDGVKYLDYASGVGAPARSPDVVPQDLRNFDLDPITVDFTVSQDKMDEVEAAMKAAVAHHDQAWQSQ